MAPPPSSFSEKTELTDILLYGIDLKNRRIYFGSSPDMPVEPEESTDFTISSVEQAVRAMHWMASDGTGRPIEIHVCSYGGDPYAMLKLYDEIQTCPCQVKFYGAGAIMSAAVWIMVGCDERYLHKNATVMVHDGSEGWEGRHTDGQILANEMRRLQDLLYDILAANTRMPKQFWQDMCQRDLYLSPEEAVALGLADRVIEPKKRGSFRKLRNSILKRVPEHRYMKKLVAKLYQRVNKLNVPQISLNAPVVDDEDAEPDTGTTATATTTTAPSKNDITASSTKEETSI